MVLDDHSDLTSAMMAMTTYDPAGNMTSLIRGEATIPGSNFLAAAFAAAHTTTRGLMYDSLGRRTHNLDPDAGTSRYYYDRFGELTRYVDARGAESRFVYDLAGRLVAEDHGLAGADGAVWIAPDGTGHSSDDDPDLVRQGNLLTQLWTNYEPDTDHDFLPQAGADVLYGFDEGYDGLSGICQGAAPASPSFVVGALAWVRDQSGCSWTS